jgi:hypothetical protein
MALKKTKMAVNTVHAMRNQFKTSVMRFCVKCSASTAFKKDKNGCEYCECQEPTPGIDIGKRNICSDVMCMMFCENGFKKDASIVPCKICRASIVLAKICELSKK